MATCATICLVCGATGHDVDDITYVDPDTGKTLRGRPREIVVTRDGVRAIACVEHPEDQKVTALRLAEGTGTVSWVPREGNE